MNKPNWTPIYEKIKTVSAEEEEVDIVALNLRPPVVMNKSTSYSTLMPLDSENENELFIN